MAALALMTAACSNDDNEFAQQPQKAEGITITAQLAPKTNGATTRAVSEGSGKIVSEWAVDEHIAVLYEVGGTKYAADATITAVDGDDYSATIEFTVESGTPNNTACTLVYPYSAAKDDHSGVKDAATLLAAQDGTLNANLDVRVGAGTIQTTTPGLTVNTQPAAQFAIFKFTVKNAAASATIDVKPLTVTIGAQDYVITPASATSELFVALPPIASQAVSFTATGSDSKTYTASKASVTFSAGKYYQSVIKMAAAARALTSATTADVGKIAGADGHIYDTKADAEAVATGNAIAMIAYVGDESDCKTGLAIALEDVSSSVYNWGDAAGAVTTWASGKTAPTIGSWRLPSIKDWQYMFIGCGASGSYSDNPSCMSYSELASKLGTAGGTALKTDEYWSSTECDPGVRAWYLYFVGGEAIFCNDLESPDYYVRACLVF